MSESLSAACLSVPSSLTLLALRNHPYPQLRHAACAAAPGGRGCERGAGSCGRWHAEDLDLEEAGADASGSAGREGEEGEGREEGEEEGQGMCDHVTRRDDGRDLELMICHDANFSYPLSSNAGVLLGKGAEKTVSRAVATDQRSGKVINA